jgi:aryl-alcohol dehydrogenase-like predicted oxidoreductase
MSKIGFGGYRISTKSEEHRKALKHAIRKGVAAIDTSSNYTGGESEKLIGEVLSDYYGDHSPLLISKVGYLQGQNLDNADKFPEDLVVISESLKHSIHPNFIEDQIKVSLDRLQVESLDVYLLHNPEYYLKTDGSTKEEYYRRIAVAFNKLEELVERGFIKSYGISSNTFIDPREDATSTDLDTVYNIAKKIKEDNRFDWIQFPMNMIEMGALERQYAGVNLIERAKQYNIKTMINRPLNAFSDHGLLRLASYQVDEKYGDSKFSDEVFNTGIKTLCDKWLEVREDEEDHLFDLPLMKQVNTSWNKQFSKDAVDQIFMGYFFPLVANVWGRDLKPSESQVFYDLYEHAQEFAKYNMNLRGAQFEKQAIDNGLLFESDMSLSQKVIEKYQSLGVDLILVGMKSTPYVDDLKKYFKD